MYGTRVNQTDDDERREAERRKQDSAGIDRMIGGALAVPVGVARDAINNMGTDIANLGRRAIGGELLPRPGYRHTAAAVQRTQDGAAAFTGASSRLAGNTQSALREATGVNAAVDLPEPQPVERSDFAPQTRSRSVTARATAAQQPQSQPENQAAIPPDTNGSDWKRTGIGEGAAGGEIAVGVGANGERSFTNENATQGAISNADGIAQGYGTRGSFSQLSAGSAQEAIARFGRANEIRAGIQRPRELGDNGGRLTVVRDSSRTPTLNDRKQARHEAQLAQTDAIRAGINQGYMRAQDAQQNTQINQQRSQQEIALGAMQIQSAQQLQQIAAQLDNPALSVEQRRALMDQYNTLSGKGVENRYTVVAGGQEFDPKAGIDGSMVNRPSRVFNNQTGQFVDAPASQPQAMPAPKVGEVQGGHRFKGGDPSIQANWERV